jgi:hypothetical protein
MSEFKTMPKMSSSENSLANAGSGSSRSVNGKVKVATASNSSKGVQKFKDGGKVKKADGGAMGALADAATSRMALKGLAKKKPQPMGGRPMVGAPTSIGGQPSRGQPFAPAPAPTGMATPAMKKGGAMKKAEGGKADMAQDKAMIKKAFKQHDAQEHKDGKGTDLKLKTGGTPPKFKGGGSIGGASKVYSSGTSGMPRGTEPTATKAALNSGEAGFAKTRHKTTQGVTSSGLTNYGSGTKGVDKTRTGAFAFGGPVGNDPQVVQGKAKGGKVKKYANGGTVAGKPLLGAKKMEEGKRAPSAPVRIDRLAGTF